MTKKVLISIYNVANLYRFSHQKQPPYLLHRMFKTYVLTNNIKVNTTKFLSMGLMKLATKTTEPATYHRGDLSSIDHY